MWLVLMRFRLFDEVQENGEAAGTESVEAEGQLLRLNIILRQMEL